MKSKRFFKIAILFSAITVIASVGISFDLYVRYQMLKQRVETENTTADIQPVVEILECATDESIVYDIDSLQEVLNRSAEAVLEGV